MKNLQVAMLYASMLVQNGRAVEASVILNSLAAQGYETSKCFILLQISADLQNDPTLAQKQKALALLEHMRSKGKIPECGTVKSREPDSKLPKQVEEEEGAAAKEKTYVIVSAPAYKDVRLSQEEENEVYLDLAEFLNEKSFCVLACKCMEYVTDKESLRVRFANAKSLMLLLKVDEAMTNLHHLFTNVDPELIEAHIMYGHCKFIKNSHEEAL